MQLQEGDTVLEVNVGRLSNGQWSWRARGVGVAEFCPVFIKPSPDGWFYFGPFRSERAAIRDSEKFERAFMRARGVEVEDAPDPRSMN
jgi:hypothetical protein